MSDVIIQAENLGKQYRIGARRNGGARYNSLRDDIMHSISAPLRWFNRSADRSEKEDNTIWALKDVSFEIKQGEVVGIIGRNGAGKSTLLKILSRITDPTIGRVRLDGRVGALLEVGTGFHPELTGRENIYLNGAILGMRRTEIVRKFDEIVDFAEIEKFIDTPAKFYSSGMYMRLAFAVAAHLEPEILVVDEVLAVGDAQFQKKCLGKMQSIAGEGRTVLFVSHNMDAVRRLCQRVMLFDKGQVVEDGPAQTIIADYLQSGALIEERTWVSVNQSPGDEVVRIKAVRVRNALGELQSEFKVYEKFSIEVDFWVLRPEKLDAVFYFYNEAGTLIFLAGDFQSTIWHDRVRPAGIHRSICHIPEHLLNEGTLNVMLAVATHPHTLRVMINDVLTIRVIDDFILGGARGNYVRPWPGGIVRPLLEWSFEFQMDAEDSESINSDE